MRLSLKLTLLPLLALASLTACTGDEDPLAPDGDDDTAELEPACEESITELASLDDLTPEGYAAADLIDLAAGDHEFMLIWAAQDAAVKLNVPAEEAEILAASILPDDLAGMRYVASTPNADAIEAGAEAELDCRSRIEIDSRLNLATEGQLLNELFEVVLQAEIGEEGLGRPTIHHEFGIDELVGDLQSIAIEPQDPSAVGFSLDMEFPSAADGPEVLPTGRIDGWAEYTVGEGDEAEVMMSPFALAAW